MEYCKTKNPSQTFSRINIITSREPRRPHSRIPLSCGPSMKAADEAFVRVRQLPQGQDITTRRHEDPSHPFDRHQMWLLCWHKVQRISKVCYSGTPKCYIVVHNPTHNTRTGSTCFPGGINGRRETWSKRVPFFGEHSTKQEKFLPPHDRTSTTTIIWTRHHLNHDFFGIHPMVINLQKNMIIMSSIANSVFFAPNHVHMVIDKLFLQFRVRIPSCLVCCVLPSKSATQMWATPFQQENKTLWTRNCRKSFTIAIWTWLGAGSALFAILDKRAYSSASSQW